jgi:hypothetical protein
VVATATARLPEAASSDEAADVDFARLARFFETPKMEVAALEESNILVFVNVRLTAKYMRRRSVKGSVKILDKRRNMGTHEEMIKYIFIF